ncbi:MAG: glutamate--tRNA ligase [Candidatus Methanomethylicota archaeon]|jgi:glutamyl-tRNA synthetase|uniref:Glutamate--tRNA ligase n=1 Tax=Thermoproteota archaeon TaxID=2056631 RepID=A0A520KEE9_9CREN|nr:MAG: glutamate--tRNA ligase [Candidatus Verstraetearchaeota archaeon]TDA38428.1 MAG: glutamate--tRNA ligase [Candidatus Verstraetearchaeota archaeon]
MISDEILLLIKKHVIMNAIKYGGKAEFKAVMGKILSEKPELKSMIQEVSKITQSIISEINSMSLLEQQNLAKSLGISLTKEKPKKEEHVLPPLPNANKYEKIRVRFAPNPDFAIHLGNARAAILNDEYAKIYHGIFILRFEDTSPSVKPPMLEAYDAIREDLKWLGVNWHEEYIQSERLPIYYDYAEKLLEIGGAYICTCPPEEFRKLVNSSKPCPCRDLPIEKQLKRWEGMMDGSIKKGGAVMRIKTDLNHPNPAIREWPAMRIDTKPHPLQGQKYRVWPLYNFACGIDDHLMGITHILRGKEHEVNTQRQIYLYKYFKWEYPEVIHYGRLKIEGTILSKSKMRQGIEMGLFKDWEDPRLGTIAALRRRGFLPETIRRLILEVGVKPSEATISWDNIEAINRKLLDPITKRFVFIPNPIKLEIQGLTKEFEARIPLHPDRPELGNVTYKVGPSNNTIFVPLRDISGIKVGTIFRLMNLFNVELLSPSICVYIGESIEEIRRINAPIIQWLPYGIELSIVMHDGSTIDGIVDRNILNENLPNVFQFYRFGFVKIYKEDGKIKGYYTHD